MQKGTNLGGAPRFLTRERRACYTVQASVKFSKASDVVAALAPGPPQVFRGGGSRVLKAVTEETTELTLPSRIEAIAEAAEAAAEHARRSGFPEDALYGIDMAVREAVTNAVLHGNKRDETKRVELGLTSSPTSLQITVRDHGTGFDPATVPDPTDEQNLLKASGRGILFMRTFMDEVEWARHPQGGTLVRMKKRR